MILAATVADPDAIRRWVIDIESAGFEHVLAYDHDHQTVNDPHHTSKHKGVALTS